MSAVLALTEGSLRLFKFIPDEFLVRLLPTRIFNSFGYMPNLLSIIRPSIYPLQIEYRHL